MPNFDSQELTITNDLWTVELCYESGHCETKKLSDSYFDTRIELNDVGNWTGNLAIKTISNNAPERTCLIEGVDDGHYLHKKDKNDNSQSVKLVDNNLIISLGFTFLLFDLNQQEIKWKLRPDLAEVFEFYDLEEDFLVRGELEIHRIDINGVVKWSYGGRDIWVNVDGKKEVQIGENKIMLTDFNGNEYVIDFLGRTLADNPRIIETPKWWKFW